MDPFSLKRLARFVSEYRKTTGELPTAKELEVEGFSSEDIQFALKKKVIEELYVTLTNGTIVKGFKVVV